VETSSSKIESNSISENMKSNIAFGGSKSENTLIISNIISDSKSEGIFMI
jgi:F-box protein 11